MEIQERMEACERKKHEGNILFKAEKFQLASKKYDKECDLRKYSNTEQNIGARARDIKHFFCTN